MGSQRSVGESSSGHVLDLGGGGVVIIALGGHQVLPFQALGKTLVLGPQSLALIFPFVTQAPYQIFRFTILFFQQETKVLTPTFLVRIGGTAWKEALSSSLASV